MVEPKDGLRFEDCRTVEGKGMWLQEHSPTAYDPSEMYWLTGAWHEMSKLEPYEAVGIAEELLRRAKARLAQHQSEMLRSWGVGNKGPK